VELRVALARFVRKLRKQRALTQAQLAAKMGSDQARISRLELNDPAVSVDQMLEAAFSLGARRKDIVEAIAG
jgi:transcriptional regulator with XRE-family HTH domain